MLKRICSKSSWLNLVVTLCVMITPLIAPLLTAADEEEMLLAPAGDNQIASENFTIVTYNIGDTAIVNSHVREIAEHLSADKPDIIAAQEDWSYVLGYRLGTHQANYINYQAFVDSGLTWHAQPGYRWDYFHGEYWEDCDNGGVFPWTWTLDCWEDKGFTHVIQRLPNMKDLDPPIHIYNVHTDAGRTEGDRYARSQNLWQLKRYIQEHTPSYVPLIILGDLNLKRGDRKDMDLLNAFKYQLGLEQAHFIIQDGAAYVNPKYDYVLYRDSLETDENGYGGKLEILDTWSPYCYDNLSGNSHWPLFTKFKYRVFQDYTPPVKAASIAEPKDGTQFENSTVDFRIDLGSGAINPSLYIADKPDPAGYYDYLVTHFFQVGETQATIKDLPTDGRPLYAWVKSYLSSLGEWRWSDRYTYYAYDEQEPPQPVPAKLMKPDPQQPQLDDVKVKFEWTRGEYLDQYRLLVERENGADIIDHTTTNTSVWVDDLPDKGQNVYVTLESYSDGEVINAESYVFEAVYIEPQPQDELPFGSLDTPDDGVEVSGSIPVTGWALDDQQVTSVKIYRDNNVYVGDATFVEGARPDVAAAYPNYPNNNNAGWGYLLLTNNLPNNGNGTFTLYAVATDSAGQQTTLGTAAITANNDEAIAPFGTIDTPAQGGLASGSNYVVWGWALTPQPNKIPEDGSTITVWVDGEPVGHPTYNVFRQDVYDAFPNYANSGDPAHPENGGPVGYFYLDTTQYENGVHTIAWSVADNAGNSAGIGSRYFTIQNDLAAAADTGPSVTVKSPNGYEFFEMGHSRDITWNARDLDDTIRITLWKDGELVGSITDNNLDPSSGRYAWEVGTLVDGTIVEEGPGYSIKIKEKGTTVADYSDEPFYITNSLLLLKSPTEAAMPHGDTRTISWEPAFLIGNVTISLWKDGVKQGDIASDLDLFDPYSNQGSYSWKVGTLADGTTVEPGSGYTIRVEEEGGPLTDQSDPFTIGIPTTAMFERIGEMTGGVPRTRIWGNRGITNADIPDGPIAVGRGSDGGEGSGYTAFRWQGGTFDGLPRAGSGSYSSHSHAYGISADGSVVYGYDYDVGLPVVWTDTGSGWEYANTITLDSGGGWGALCANGQVIVDFKDDVVYKYTTSDNWATPGGVSKQVLSGLTSAYACSPDGTIIVGTNASGPAIYDGSGVVSLPGDGVGYAVSDDGTVVAGVSPTNQYGKNEPCKWVYSGGAWTQTILPLLPGMVPEVNGKTGAALAVSADGKRIAGHFREYGDYYIPLIWDSNGVQRLEDVLNSSGIYIEPGWYLADLGAMSPDGRTFGGSMSDQPIGSADDNRHAWIASIDLNREARFVSQSVPTSLQPGEQATVWVKMENTGDATWTRTEDYKLGSQNPHDNTTWGLKRVRVPHDVPPGGVVTFDFSITAPSVPGTYDFQWRMLQERVEWFGERTANVQIVVPSVNLAPNAGFEDGKVGWTEKAPATFPGTSFFRHTWGVAAPHGGSYGYAISNHAYGYLQSDAISVSPGTQYDLYAYVRGELDPDDSAGSWLIRAAFYDANGGYLSYQNAASGGAGTLDTTWQHKGGRITTPSDAATVRIQLYNYMNSGWVAYDDVSLKAVGSGTNLAPNAGFEDGKTGWNEIRQSSYPGTSFFRHTWGTAAPHGGSYGYAISNHAYGYLQSDALPVSPDTQYDLYAYVRGELDPDDSAGKWLIRAAFYDANGSYLSYQNAASGAAGTLDTTWQQKGGRITTPSNAASLRIQLYNYMNSGWVAFDDVSLKREVDADNLAPNPGFEDGKAGWGEIRQSSYPGTSFFRHTWGTAAPHGGSYGYAISNHLYGYLQSDALPVSPDTQYNLYTYVRGELDPDDSAGIWLIRAAFYDANGSYLGYQDAASGVAGTLDTTWQQKGGRITTPSNAATIRIQLYNGRNSGWVAYDDVSLEAVGN